MPVSPFEKPALRSYNFDWVVVMRRNAIDFETLLRITEGFCKEKGLDNSRGKRGRPPLYPMSVILAIWLLKTMLRLSYRQTEAVLRSFLFQNMPDFSTLHYRVSTIEEELWQEFLEWLANKSTDQEEIKALLVDGTGWGYGLPFYQRAKRGQEIRKIKSHVKGVIVLGLTERGHRIVMGASLGRAYSDERKLFLSWLNGSKLKEEGLYLVGDKLYGMSTQVLKEIIKRGWIPVIKIEESLHKGIKEGIRKLAAKSYNDHLDIYKKRCLIESFIGTTKGMYGSYLEEKTQDRAFHVVFAQLALWNIGNIIFVLFLIMVRKGIFKQPQNFWALCQIVWKHSGWPCP